MSLERVEKYDIIKVTYASDVEEVKKNIDKLNLFEPVFTTLDKKLCIKTTEGLFSVQLTKEV
jgi:hypothetical protein